MKHHLIFTVITIMSFNSIANANANESKKSAGLAQRKELSKQDITGIELNFTECKIVGPSNDDIKALAALDADAGSVSCRKIKGVDFNCSFSAGGEELRYEIAFFEGGIGAGISHGSNEQFIIKLKDNWFSWGKAYAVLSQGYIISKNCVGTVKSVVRH